MAEQKQKARFASPAHNLARVFRGIPLSVAYLVGRMIPRNRNLWVFGNLVGFQDNPRYLLEYVKDAHPEIRTVWLASTLEARDEARRSGYEAHLTTSAAGIAAAFRAGTGIICMRLADVNRAAIGGMFVVNGWHGSPLKRVLLDAEIEWKVSRGWIGQVLGRISRWMLARAHHEVDLVTAPSETVKSRFVTAFGLPASKIALTGYARSDIVMGTGAPVRESLGWQLDARIVLYAPTWRETRGFGELWEGFDREQWEALLARTNSYFVVKLHPHTPLEEIQWLIQQPSRILVATAEHAVLRDINRLLPSVDVLVTDYSSVAFDFALLERPIAFFAPDYDDFKQSRNFYEPYDAVTRGTHTTSWKGLLDAVASCLDGDASVYLANALALKGRYNSFSDTQSRARIVKEILSRR